MGVQVLSPPESHQRSVRTLPRLPGNSHYSLKPMSSIKPSRALPSVPNPKVNNTHDQHTGSKVSSRALPRVPKPPNVKKDPNMPTKNHRVLPEVPASKDGNTSGSSRSSTPRAHRTLPKLPKLQQKQKPEQSRIEYMHDVYKKEGDNFADEGNHEQAIKSYNLALKFITDDPVAITARSRAHQKLGKHRKAMQDADLALKLDPQYHEALLQKAELLLEVNDYENALAYFTKGAKQRPDKDEFHDGIDKTKNRIAEAHKGIRKRKNTISPDDVNISVTKKSKEKGKKHHHQKEREKSATSHRDALHREHSRSNSNHSGSNQDSPKSTKESTIMAPHPPHNPPPVPHPPMMPHPPTTNRNLRQQTPMPARLKVKPSYRPFERTTQQNIPQTPPPKEEDVDNDMMKQILGRMYNDKEYFEKLVEQAENLPPPPNQQGTNMNLHSVAENGLHFIYDRVLYWVKQGRIMPPVMAPTPRDTKASLNRKAMAHGSSVESILEEQAKEELTARKRKKKHPKAAPTWFRFLEQKKLDEAAERNKHKNVFLHVVEGTKIEPRGNVITEVKKSKRGPETTKRLTDEKHKDKKEFSSDESLGFAFRSYRPNSDLRNNLSNLGSPMETDEDYTSRKTPPKKLQQYMKKNKKTEAEKRKERVTRYIKKEMEEVEGAYAENKHDLCLEKAKHIIELLEREDVEEKYNWMSLLHSFIGNAFIGLKDYEKALHHHKIDLKIGEENKLDESVSRALGNLGRIYVVQKRHQEALEVYLKKTPMCTSRIETAWLFHEIGNCFLALGDFEYAKDAAKKSLEAAEEAVEWSYQLQSCVLMGVAEVKLKQYHAAFNTFERALDQARLQGDEKAEEAIREALEDVNERILEDMRTKGLDFQNVRADFSRSKSYGDMSSGGFSRYELSKSRQEIARMQAEFGHRHRADYAKSRAQESDYSSIDIPEDDGSVTLTETGTENLQLELDRLRTQSTLFDSQLDLRDHIHTDRFVSGR